MTDERQQPTTEVTQAVADSNAAAVTSLSTSISGTVSTSQEAPETLGKSSDVPVADALTPANVTVNQAASPSTISNGETLGSTDAPAVAQVGESVGNGSSGSAPLSTSDASATLSNAASTSSAEASASSTSDTMSTHALSSSASIPGSSAADATLADVGEQAEPPVQLDHPAKPHIRGFLRKIEAGEAIVLADVESVLRRIEEML